MSLGPLSTSKDRSPSSLLRAKLGEIISRNPAYSLRAFARDLGVSPTYASMILSGKKNVSVERATQMTQVLKMTDTESQGFLALVVNKSKAKRGAYKYLQKMLSEKSVSEMLTETESERQIRELEIERFKIVSEWHHFALLDLIDCRESKSDITWLARRLSLSSIVVRDAVERLLRVGLLKSQKGRLKKTNVDVFVGSKFHVSYAREFHRQMLTKALETISTRGPEISYHSRVLSHTLSVNPDQLENAKAAIDAFCRKLMQSLDQGQTSEVYQFNIQLLPLTKPERID